MQNLINFLIRYNSWLFFAALETVCLILVFTYNPYQERVYISSANQISGQLYTGLSQISEYFYLRSKNEELVKENNDLLQQVLLLNQYIADNEIDSVNPGIFTNPLNAGQRYEFVPARVIGNSITRTHNYITLNKGSQSGLKSGLGVIDQNGVVGVIGNVSEKYAVVIPILNPQFRLSVKLKKNNYFGSLVWNGVDSRHAVLEELPRHARCADGDTLVTSGYSEIFPDGIMVGTIIDDNPHDDDNFYAIKTLLSVDFARLRNVLIIIDKDSDEQKKLEEPYKKELNK